jgi:hypothetical protein
MQLQLATSLGSRSSFLTRSVLYLEPIFTATLIGNLPSNNFQVLVAGKEVAQVNIPATTGDMGILSKHEPVIEELRPGVVEVKMLDGESKKWFGACFHFSSLFLVFRCL